MAHTPGPWQACGDGNCSCGQVWSRPADQPVARANTVWGDDLEHPYGEIPAEEMHANARLIAAAPDLLEACLPLDAQLTMALSSFGAAERALGGPLTDEDAVTVSIGLLRAIRAAIAKATQGTED